MATGPKTLSIRTYHVGFGDCFLLSFGFGFGGKSEKHVLIDFGSTGMPTGVPKSRMMDIANDIKARSGGKLAAVVATHRHKDHISGFETNAKKTGSGDVIAALKPDLVVQPWTENPKLPVDATSGPADSEATRTAKAIVSHVGALRNMGLVAGRAAAAMKSRRYIAKDVREQMSFLGDDNLSNLSAVKNLMTMGKKSEYINAGSKTGLQSLLPGVKVHVLGPPTVKQSGAVKKQRSSDPNEFWQFQANALAAVVSNGSAKPPGLFPKYVKSSGPKFPIESRWLIYHSRTAHANQSLAIVRMLDSVMNNTSIILLFEIGGRYFLFPGDAQIENWQYSLDKDDVKKLLGEVELYKVGHHGSRNATPKTLWGLFKKKAPKPGKGRLVSLMSTMPHKHGSESAKTEVPRKTLEDALRANSDLFSTTDLKGKDFYHDTLITF